MPYLQLDVNGRHAVHNKRQLALRLCETYARLMGVDIRHINVGIRENGEGGIWRMVDGEPVTVSVLRCDVHRARTTEQQMQVARALCRDCIEVLGLHEKRLNVEFTKHAVDEVYHPTLGGYGPEWSEEEVGATVGQ